MMRSKILIPLSIATSLLLHQTAIAAFSDVPSNHPNNDAIMYMQSEGIVEGYFDGTFKPEQKINRAEFLKIIIRAIEFAGDCPLRDGAFSDVHPDQWFAVYVCTGTSLNIIDGYPDGTFRPNQNINFAEAAKMIVEAFDLSVAEGGVWYEGYVRALESGGAIPLEIDSLDSDITRGEMAEMIYRLKENIIDKSSKRYDQLTVSDAKYADSQFDGCGKISAYSDYPWYSELSVLAQPPFNDEFVTEACFAENTGLLVFIRNEGYGNTGEVFRFDSLNGVLQEASLLNTDSKYWWAIHEFGKRSGHIIPITGIIRDMGCSIYAYDYDFVANTVTYTNTEHPESC